MLEDGTYRITVEGILNLRSLAGRADTTFAYPELEAANVDTGAAKPDAAEPEAAEAEPDDTEGGGR